MTNTMYALIETYEGWEDAAYNMYFFATKEKAYSEFYRRALSDYEVELSRQTKKECKRDKGNWEAAHSRQDFETYMARNKELWFNENDGISTFETESPWDSNVCYCAGGHNSVWELVIIKGIE